MMRVQDTPTDAVPPDAAPPAPRPVSLTARAAVPLAAHLAAATLLVLRITPALRERLDAMAPLRRGVPGLVLGLAYLPAVVPSAAVALAAPWARRSPEAARWWSMALWLIVADTVLRAAVAWTLPAPVVLGDVIQRVAMSPDALGRLLHEAMPGSARWVGAMAGVGVMQLLAAVCAGIAAAQGRHGPGSPVPLAQLELRGALAGVTGAALLAVGARAASGPAVAVWLAAAG